MGNQSSVQVVCAEYEGLLNESQVALTSWAYERAEISGHRGRDVNDKLRTLQRDFLKAWALLQNHKRDCEVCQVISAIEHVHAGTRAAALRAPFSNSRSLFFAASRNTTFGTGSFKRTVGISKRTTA
jgi:hypothetical protein